MSEIASFTIDITKNDKKKAKYEPKKGSGNGKAEVTTNGDITIDVAKNTAIELIFNLVKYKNYTFGANSFAATEVGQATPMAEFTSIFDSENPRTLTVKDLNSDGQCWSYCLTIYGISSEYPTQTLDPMIKNKT